MSTPKHWSTFWPRFGSVLITLASLILLGLAIRGHLDSGPLSSSLLTFVLIALAVAIALHARFLLFARGECRQTENALDAAEREYKSVFDNALDSILILDDESVCLQANGAALKLFGSDRHGLVGQSIDKFFAADSDFKTTRRRISVPAHQQKEACVSRCDGRTIFVEYTVTTDFLPGRHVIVIRDISQRRQAESRLRESEERFRQMACNIQEVFWMLDTAKMEVLYVNPAYETITGRASQSLNDDPKSYEDVIHPEDRIRVLLRLEESVRSGQFDEEFRIVRPEGTTRWVWARGFPVRDSRGIVRRLVGTAQDITLRRFAEEQMARNLDMAEAARAEAEAFRKTSLALTQDLSMDYVLDTLLQSLLDLVPCESAQIILVEAGTRLFLAREIQNFRITGHLPNPIATLDARDSGFLMEILTTKKSTLISDTGQEHEWASFRGFSHLRSWLCVPLVASQQVLGFLSLGDTHAQTFTHVHLRLAKLLAIPASVAIQNARLYEQAELFRREVEQRLVGLERTDEAARRSERNQRPS
jgi:PAS domain S-box-containing protein